MAELLAQLEAEYCPPLDPALLSAILSDFDLHDQTHVQQARGTLDPLKESALLEEEAGFDASGTGAQHGDLEDDGQARSGPGTSEVRSQETDLTSLSNGVSSLSLEEGLTGETSPDQRNVNDAIESMDEDTKVDLLLEVLEAKVTRTHARYTLIKCKENWVRAMEELMTYISLDGASHSDDGSKVTAKGIDAFSEDNMIRRGRKGKAKKRNLKQFDEQRSSSLPVSAVESLKPFANKWQSSTADIDFIATRVNMSHSTVTSIYNAHGASTSRTIGAILKTNVQNATPSEDPILAVNAHELSLEFPSIASDYVAALIRLTHPSTAAAHELAKALTAKPASAGGIQIIPRYTAPNLEDDGGPRETASRRNWSRVDGGIDTSNASAQAGSYAAARSAALAQAHAAHRKAKSDRLMGGAAAYYAERSRELAALQSGASANAADQLAASQSSLNQVDLHGIDVLNGVRIAQARVEQWWDRLGEGRSNGRLGAGERQAGFTIVVGLGRHSEGGKGKLGPAVSKMLKTEGWRFEPAGPLIVVQGKLRRQ